MADRTLRYASTGDDVRTLQQGLNRMPSKLPPLVEDGIYGAKTTKRVQEFQHGNSLTPDGVTGPATWEVFHFLIESADGGGKLPRMSTIDGNQDYGRILRIWSSDPKAHQVGKDNFNYYSFA